MIDCPYFWGKITHEEAMEILEGKPTGSIILRESNPIEDDHTTRNNMLTLISETKQSKIFWLITCSMK